MNFLLLIVIIITLRVLNSVIKTEGKKQLPFVASNKREASSLMAYYYQVLNLDFKKPITPEIVRKAFYKQLELSSEDRNRGYKPYYSLNDLKAARDYLLDFLKYGSTFN